MKRKDKIDCMGGYAFITLAIGIMMLIPASILTAIYANDSGSTLQAVSFGLLGGSLLFLFLGILLTSCWCRKTDGGMKIKDAGEEQAEGGAEAEGSGEGDGDGKGKSKSRRNTAAAAGVSHKTISEREEAYHASSPAPSGATDNPAADNASEVNA